MRYLSVFDGMSCGRIAVEQLGLPITKYYASEIDKHAVKVAQANYPDTVHIGDVRETGVNEQCFYYTEKAIQWLGRHSRSKDKKLSVHADSDKMQMLEASRHKKYSSQRFFGIVDVPTDKHCVGAMRGRYVVNGKRQDGKMATKGLTKQFLEFRYDGKTNALTTVSKDNVVVPFTLPNRVPVEDFFFRYITPLKCERLQTVPDGYTDHVSNTQRYKMLGNGWTVDVIKHILQGIKP